jgi:hypothetical protein
MVFFFCEGHYEEGKVSPKISKILLDLSRTPGADSQVLRRAGATYKSTSHGWLQLRHPLRFVTRVVSIQLLLVRAKIAWSRSPPSYSNAYNAKKSVDGLQRGTDPALVWPEFFLN